MKASSDEAHAKYKDYDFSDAKPVAETPHLAKLQAVSGKSRITIRVDNEVLAAFKASDGDRWKLPDADERCAKAIRPRSETDRRGA